MKTKQLMLACGLATMMMASTADADAQKLKFSERSVKDAPAMYAAPMSPENVWVTNYKGTSFLVNWDAMADADSYYLDVFSTDKNNIQSFNEKFDGINSSNGYIDEVNPCYPEGWTVDVSTFGDKDMLFDGVSDKISMDANGDFLRMPTVNGYITSVVIDMNVVNIPENAYVDEENTSAIIFRLYDDHNFCVREGAVSTLIFAETPKVDLFMDLFSYLPPTITSVEFALEKNDQRVYGDLMVNSISYSYAPRMDLLKDAKVSGANSYLVENTDPESVYFCNVKAANGSEVSEKSHTLMIDMLVTPEPEIFNVTSNSYDIEWTAVPRCQIYDIYNYNLMEVKEDASLVMLHENFDNITEGTFDDPVVVENADDFTGTPGWAGSKMLAAAGMFGADNGTFAGWPNPGMVYTPELDLSGNGGKYTISIKAYGTPGDYLAVYREGYVVDGKLNIHNVATFPEDGYIEETWEMEDGVADMRIAIAPMNMKRFFIDEITVSQDRKAGDIIKLNTECSAWIENNDVDSYYFVNLDEGQMYGCEMRAMRYDDAGNIIMSEMSQLQVVVLLSTGIEKKVADGISLTAADGKLNINLSGEEKVAIYAADGKLVAERVCGAGSNVFALDGNMYIVKIGNVSYKVIVK